MRSIPRISPLSLIIVALAVLVLAVYWQVGSHEFIMFDDTYYVTDNPIVLRGLSLDGVRWAFTTFHASNWHPLTWLSHMADVSLFGPDAGWHHRVNALLHLLNTELLFLVLWRMTGGLWQSAFVAALFGVHPLHVESVAWVAERKDVLSALFWILTMGAYLRYVRRPGTGRYILVVATFALGLLSKPMIVTLPFVLLLLDWWPLGRLSPAGSPGSSARWRALSRLAWEKAPLVGLSAISCVITYLAQAKVAAISRLADLTFGPRISNALVSYGVYLAKTAWPSALAVFYPHPVTIQIVIPAWKIAGSILLLGGLSALALRQGVRRPCLAVGWLWFLGTLVPVIGLIQVGSQAMADRYTYIPLIGVFMAIIWGTHDSLTGWRFRAPLLGALGGAAVLALSAIAWSQTGYWRNDFTLSSRAVAVTDRNWLALTNLGAAHDKLGQTRRAIAYYSEALRVNPEFAETWNGVGVACGKIGQLQEATTSFQQALRIRPDFPDAWINLGLVHDTVGQPGEAIKYYLEALRIEPDSALAWTVLGMAYAKLEQLQQAIGCYREALRIRPDFALARTNLDAAYGKLGQPRKH